MSANMQCANVNGGCGSRAAGQTGTGNEEAIVGGGVEGKVDSRIYVLPFVSRFASAKLQHQVSGAGGKY
jgi:hypothetical protein